MICTMNGPSDGNRIWQRYAKTAVFWKNTIYRKVQNLYNATFDFAAMLTLLIG